MDFTALLLAGMLTAAWLLMMAAVHSLDPEREARFRRASTVLFILTVILIAVYLHSITP